MAEIKNTETEEKVDKPVEEKKGNDSSSSKKKGGKRGNNRSQGDRSGKTNGPESKRFNKMEMRNPALLSAVATYPFSYVAGLPTGLDNYRNLAGSGPFSDGRLSSLGNNKLITPGVCVCYVRPSLPVTDSSTSAVNVAFLQEYTFLRHTISASLPYEAADVAMYYLAGAEVYALINFLTRVYACAFMFTPQNRYTPEALIRVQGVDPSTVVTNLAQCRASLNLLIERAAALPLPAKIPYISDRASKFADIYTEGTSIKDQLYMYSPEGFWRFGDTLINNKPGLKYEKKVSESIPQLSFSSWCNYGMELLNGLFNSQTTGIIGANVRRAYGDSNLMLLAVVPEFMTVVPEFNIGVLEQMANSDILDEFMRMSHDASGTYNVDTRWDISQEVYSESDPAFWIKFKPTLRVPMSRSDYTTRVNSELTKFVETGDITKVPTILGLTGTFATSILSHVLTTSTSETSPELVVESSRQMIVLRPEQYATTDTYQELSIVSQSSIITECVMYTFDYGLEYADIPNMYRVAIAKYNQSNNLMGFKLFNIMPLLSNKGVASSAGILAGIDQWTVQNRTVAMWDYLRDTFEFAPKQYIIAGYLESATGTLGSNTVVRQARDLDNYTILDAVGLEKIHEVATLELFSIPGVASAY